MRLDLWLDVACLYKTRSEAQKACKLGKISVNGQYAKAHRDVKVGDRLMLSRPLGRKQTIVVVAIAEAHIARADARLLYEDRTPPPTAEEVEARKLERIFRASTVQATRPDRRQRRQLRQFSGKD